MICLSMLVLPVILLVRLTSSLPLLHSLAGQDTLRNAFLTEEPGEVPSARVPRQPPVTLPPITLPLPPPSLSCNPPVVHTSHCASRIFAKLKPPRGETVAKRT